MFMHIKVLSIRGCTAVGDDLNCSLCHDVMKRLERKRILCEFNEIFIDVNLDTENEVP